MSLPSPWTIAITVRGDSTENLIWLQRTLSPELAREVPRASATLSAPNPRTLRIEVRAKDTGAARAATNTYLGWIHLAWETVVRARSAGDATRRR